MWSQNPFVWVLGPQRLVTFVISVLEMFLLTYLFVQRPNGEARLDDIDYCRCQITLGEIAIRTLGRTVQQPDMQPRIAQLSPKVFSLFSTTDSLYAFLAALTNFNNMLQYFYRAMHFSAKRGIAIACRLSVRPSVRL